MAQRQAPVTVRILGQVSPVCSLCFRLVTVVVRVCEECHKRPSRIAQLLAFALPVSAGSVLYPREMPLLEPPALEPTPLIEREEASERGVCA